MGLLAKFANQNNQSTRTSTDTTLLALVMGCMGNADGGLTPSEIAYIQAFASALPDFPGNTFGEAWDNSVRMFLKHNQEAAQAVEELKAFSSPLMKKKAFVVAVDIAFSSGDIKESEDQLLTKMKEVLGIDDIFAQKTVEVISAKYAV